MFKIILPILISLNIYANNLKPNLLECDIEQKIKSSSNEITYNGDIYYHSSKKEIIWNYDEPHKTIYINSIANITYMTIIEPELEQATIIKNSKSSIFDILLLDISKMSEKKKVGDIEYNINYVLQGDFKIFKNINYVDELENKVNINFKNCNTDPKLRNKSLKIPEEYDIIKKEIK